MNKYIELQDALERLNELYHGYEVEEWLKSLLTIEVSEDAISREWVSVNMLKYGFHAPDMTVGEFLADAPSVVPKAKEGEWIEDNLGTVICSECKRPRRDSRINHTKFCNSCGAKMGRSRR